MPHYAASLFAKLRIQESLVNSMHAEMFFVILVYLCCRLLIFFKVNMRDYRVNS